MSDGFLHKYFLNNGHRRLHKWLHYFDIYERHFARFRGASPVMIEIGVAKGGSLAMWKDYFGMGSRIVGIDVNPECKAYEGDGIEVFIGSQDDPALIETIFSRYPRVDIILDDGSHLSRHMIASFELMYHRVHPNGVYVVEDTHTSYWAEYEGGFRQKGTFIEFAKDKIDELHAALSREALPVSGFTRSTDCIACYDSVVVFERRPQAGRQAPMTQAM